MGYEKNRAIAMQGRKVTPAPDDGKRMLLLVLDGRLEPVRIGYPGKGAKAIAWPVVDGQKYMVSDSDYGYVAMPIKPKGKPEQTGGTDNVVRLPAREVEKPIKLDPLGERFTQWFNFGSYAIVNDGEGWKTLQHRISSTKIYELWKDPNTAIGLRFGKETSVGFLDLDVNGHHHNEADLASACEAIETIGIYEPIPIQSSHSGGWHLWFAFPQAVPTFALSCALQEVLAKFGFDISPGNLEIFPNRKGWTKGDITHYNGGRLPLQPGSGSALLDNDLVPYSTLIATFLDLLEESAAACDIDLLLEACTEARENYNPFVRANGFAPHSKKASEWRKSDLAIIAQPWEPHDSNNRLGIIARYGVVFERLTGDDLVDYIVQTAIATPDYSRYCRHQHQIEPWARRWARCAEKKYYAYEPKKQTKAPGPSNEDRREAAMVRLIEAMADLKTTNRLPSGVKKRESLLIGLIGISKSTLWKPDYQDLWHPRFDPVLHGDHPPVADIAESQAQQDLEQVAPHPSTKTVYGVSPGSPPEKKEFTSASGLTQNLPLERLPHDVLIFCASTTDEIAETLTHQEIQPLSVTMNVPNSEKTNVKPRFRVINRPTAPIADVADVADVADFANPFGLVAGDWVVDVQNPYRLMRLTGIDADGEWCRLHKSDYRSSTLIGELAYLSDLKPAPASLIAEYSPVPNGDRL